MPGAIKARYQVGPVDPTILYVGDLDTRYGPDVIVKAMPAILRNHKQARLIVVGDGDLLWPLRVYSRYLLLDYAVRLVGHLDGTAATGVDAGRRPGGRAQPGRDAVVADPGRLGRTPSGRGDPSRGARPVGTRTGQRARLPERKQLRLGRRTHPL